MEIKHKIVNCPICGKIIPEYILNGDLVRKIVSCPECGSKKTCKNGRRNTFNTEIQRYLCKECGFRFS